jgi:roundabout, axon guidance receptor 2
VKFFTIFTLFYFSLSRQIKDLKPATSYIFLVRSENSYGLSEPSQLTSVIKTLGTEKGVVSPNELAAARTILSAKVRK